MREGVLAWPPEAEWGVKHVRAASRIGSGVMLGVVAIVDEQAGNLALG